MAQMYPPDVYSATLSPGEIEIFNKLKNDPETSDWLVLHSLDVAQHISRISGELDFVVIVPNKGVLCVEVKAAHSIRRDKGRWYYGYDADGDSRGPFKQVSEAMHSVKKLVFDRAPELKNVMFWSGVIFPYTPFPEKSPEWHDWQLIDEDKYRSHDISLNLLNILDNARLFLKKSPGTGWFDPSENLPTQDQCRLLVHILRSDFEFYESPASRASRRKEELKRYTEEQFDALDAMASNPRVIFQGPAGTGKTLLALEAIRRYDVLGGKTLFVCFNRLLGNWLRNEASSLKNVVVGTLHSQMLSIAGVSPPESPEPDFWEVDLPLTATEKLLGDLFTSRFDRIIMDEAQDLLKPPYLDFLDLSLTGGLSSGNWLMFGDFENQAIYENVDSVNTQLQSRFPSVPRYSLRVNCRNTPRNAELVHLLGSLSPPYSRIRRSDNQIEPRIITYTTLENEKKNLQKVLQQLLDDHFSLKDIVILSRKAEQDSVSVILSEEWQSKMVSLRSDMESNRIHYGTIHSFKGLEAPVVVLTDIEDVLSPEARALFYVGITRTLERIIILLNQDANREMSEILLERPKV